ncbi:MAG: hypothetical protein U0892_02500 [Pirellulales bacterium]
MAIFTFTIIATLYTDLLIGGIIAGIVATWLLDVSLYWRAYTKTTPAIKDRASLTGGLLGMFADHIGEQNAAKVHITISHYIVCFWLRWYPRMPGLVKPNGRRSFTSTVGTLNEPHRV